MLINCINLEYYPKLSTPPSHYFPSLSDHLFGGTGRYLAICTPLLSEGLGEASSLPLRGGSGWGFLFYSNMIYTDPHLVRTLQVILEFLGTFAFAISGIRHAAQKHFDWFGGYVCGFAVAIGGGTIRDTMLGVRPFWTANIMYVLCTGLALFLVILSRRWIQRLNNAWFVFDTLGLALFTIAGIQKTIALGHPFWVAVIMGCITGVAGGVIRDVLLNNIPVIFHKEIYAVASVAGGLIYWALFSLGLSLPITVIVTFLAICLIRFIAVGYHISLPTLQDDEEKK